MLGRDAIERILEAAGERLRGDWLVVGGAAAAVWFSPQRVTEDLDLVAFQSTNDSQLAVMQLAAEHGLPVEAINLTASYFVFRIADWQSEIEVLLQGSNATLYRPTPTLFLLLKLARLGEQDLQDCLDLIQFARTHGQTVDGARVRAALAAQGPTAVDALAARRRRLHDELAD